MNRLIGNDEQLFVYLLCKKLALDLDADDYTSLPVVSDLLMEFPVELMTSAVRSQLGLERCMKHNLDEDPYFEKVLTRINEAFVDLDEEENVSG